MKRCTDKNGHKKAKTSSVEAYKRLAAYEDEEEQDRLMMLPEILSISRINYIKEIITKQIEYAEAEATLAAKKGDNDAC